MTCHHQRLRSFKKHSNMFHSCRGKITDPTARSSPIACVQTTVTRMDRALTFFLRHRARAPRIAARSLAAWGRPVHPPARTRGQAKVCPFFTHAAHFSARHRDDVIHGFPLVEQWSSTCLLNSLTRMSSVGVLSGTRTN